MKFKISEHLDYDPIYQSLIKERNEMIDWIANFDKQHPANYNEHYNTDVRYRAFFDRMLRVSQHIINYEENSRTDINAVNVKPIAPLIVESSEELKRYLARHPEAMYELSPRRFERLIADILVDFGFEVALTQATHDRGIDIYAYLKNPSGVFLTFIECKRWQPERHVGIDVVQRLFGVQQANRANKSMIVTTSFFTKPAVEQSRRYEHLMELKDYDSLKEWLLRPA